jgi:tRNA(fMet)-specific endonuclease VapC
MDSVLLDTNIVSYLEKHDSRAEKYRPHLEGKRHVICFMTVAELYRWTIQYRWGEARVNRLRQRLNGYLVVPFDDRLAWEWAVISSVPGRPIGVADAWIAAAAKQFNLPIVTHNRKHFDHISGLTVISE